MLAACLGGCSSSDDSTGDDDTGDAVGDLLGTFAVQLIGPRTETDGTTTPGYTSVLGKVYDGATPQTVVWTAAMTSGACTLSTPSVPFCSPSCGASSACVAENTCVAYPTSQSVGAVHIDGIQTSAGTGVDLTAVSNTYQAVGTTLKYPAFAEGDALELTAAGSTFAPAFTIHSKGVATLALANSTSLALAANTALQLSWTAPTTGSSTVHVQLDISHHGGSKGKIECDAADTGALTIASALVDQLLALGAAGFPTIIVTRASTGHAAVASGHVDLVASSQVEVAISVPGVQSCTTDDQCTAPATCQDDLTCR